MKAQKFWNKITGKVPDFWYFKKHQLGDLQGVAVWKEQELQQSSWHRHSHPRASAYQKLPALAMLCEAQLRGESTEYGIIPFLEVLKTCLESYNQPKGNH